MTVFQGLLVAAFGWMRFMQRLQETPEHVRSHFRPPLARYAGCI